MRLGRELTKKRASTTPDTTKVFYCVTILDHMLQCSSKETTHLSIIICFEQCHMACVSWTSLHMKIQKTISIPRLPPKRSFDGVKMRKSNDQQWTMILRTTINAHCFIKSRIQLFVQCMLFNKCKGFHRLRYFFTNIIFLTFRTL